MMPATVSAPWRRLLAGACLAVCSTHALAGPTEDALKVGEEALAKGEVDSATTTWINAYNERAVAKTATDETCARLLWNAGTQFAKSGNATAAATCFDKLYPLRIELSGAQDPKTGIVASMLAAALTNSGGDLDRAERLAREADAILAKAGAAHRADRLTAMINLGGTLLRKKDRLAASQQFIECLQFAEKNPDAGIPGDLVAGCYDALAQIAAFFGRTADHLNYLERSRDLKARALGTHHLATFLARLEVAAALPADKAAAAYEAMLPDFYAATGTEATPALLQAWTVAEYKLAVLESQKGNQERVISLLESAIGHGTKGFGELHAELLQLNLDLAKLYLQRKQYDKGVACYRQVLAIREKHLGKEHESTKETQKLLDDLLADLAKIRPN